MNCPHCLAVNLTDSHRCVRCGRRFAGSARAAADFYPITTTATARDYAWLTEEAAPVMHTSSVAVAEPPRARVSYQKSLFDQQVVQFPIPAGGSRGRRRQPQRPQQQASGPAQPRRYVQSNHQQQSFEFQLVEEQELLMPQDGIYCDSPVAQPVHRLLAAALDSSMILIALGLFLATFYLCGGTVVLNSTTAVLYAGIYAVLWFFYRAMFGICSADTPGLVWMGLELVNFDGRRPDREQRIYRMFGGVLGVLSAGLGLVWSLVDEEQLTWHDHISKTFPSPQ